MSGPTVREVSPGPERDAYLPLLELADDSVAQVGSYYQKAGFRLRRAERDFFPPERGYPEGIHENGIPLRDMVWMDHDLDDERTHHGADRPPT